MNNITSEVGCWIDGHHGHYGPARLIQIAVDLGWDDQEAAEIASLYMEDGGMNEYNAELTYWASDDAEEWLNKHIAEEGHMFGWNDGEFFYQSMKWWSEEDY